jgi:hypothetical protein
MLILPRCASEPPSGLLAREALRSRALELPDRRLYVPDRRIRLPGRDVRPRRRRAITATNLGTGSVSSGTSVTVTALASCAVGDLVLVVVGDDTGASSATGSVSDTQSNTYSLLTSVALVSSTGTTQLFWSVLTSPLTTSDTIKFASSSGSNHQVAVSIVHAVGCATTSPVDSAVTATATASSATVSGTGGTPGQSGELWIAAVNATAPSTAPTITNTGSWAVPPNSVSGGSTTAGGGSQVGSASAPSYSATLSASVRWGVIIAAFKPAPVDVLMPQILM